MKKYLTKRNLSIAALIIIPLIIMITLGICNSVSDTCIMCSPTPTSTHAPVPTGGSSVPIPPPPSSSPVPTMELDIFGQCSTFCEESMIGDGHCDPFCNNEDCNYDGKDCGLR